MAHKISSYSTFVTSYGSKLKAQYPTIRSWYFHADKPSLPLWFQPKKSAFLFTRALLSVASRWTDTTAIQTAGKMSGGRFIPQLIYAKEQSVDAFGEPGKLECDYTVLKALQPAANESNRRFSGTFASDNKKSVAGYSSSCTASDSERIPR